ncbi:MAG: carbohydrate ABC transporter permease [Actinomycetota bacterium]|nr:carbohydrate ABC transporter permease [Actinomycetota bacterium]
MWLGIVAAPIVLCLIVIPLLWPLSTSLKEPNDILRPTATFIPSPVTLENYERLIDSGIGQYLLNSALVTAGAILIATVVGVIGGYVLSRYDFRGAAIVISFLVICLAVPIATLAVPIQSLLAPLGLMNQLWVVALIYAGIGAPFVTWLLKLHFDKIPLELERAAYMDGYSVISTLVRVLLPGTRPAILTGAVFVFLTAWNDLIIASTLLQRPEDRTIQVALSFYQGTLGREWGPLMAGIVVATVPVVVLFLMFRRLLVQGLAEGGVKG